MSIQEVLLRLKPLFEGRVIQAGYVLVDMRFYRSGDRGLVLEVLVDRPESGITLDECAGLNREFSGLIEEGDFLPGGYVLDVSSPGLDRPLATEADFRRAKDREVRFYLKDPVDGRLEYGGVVLEVSGDAVSIRTEIKKEQKIVNLLLANINKAKQVII